MNIRTDFVKALLTDRTAIREDGLNGDKDPKDCLAISYATTRVVGISVFTFIGFYSVERCRADETEFLIREGWVVYICKNLVATAKMIAYSWEAGSST